jgi:addiction module HigA family antidote
MILSFKHKGLERYFKTGKISGVQVKHSKRLKLILGRLNASTSANDMNLPGLFLHPLTGNRSDIWSVRVSGNWRVTFRFNGEHAEIVNYEDYHWDNIMLMHNPPHPGEIIKELCLEPLELSITAAANALGVSRKTLSSIINGKAGISPEMAVRLSIAFNTSSESWMNQQSQYDLWQAEMHREELDVKPLIAA